MIKIEICKGPIFIFEIQNMNHDLTVTKNFNSNASPNFERERLEFIDRYFFYRPESVLSRQDVRAEIKAEINSLLIYQQMFLLPTPPAERLSKIFDGKSDHQWYAEMIVKALRNNHGRGFSTLIENCSQGLLSSKEKGSDVWLASLAGILSPCYSDRRESCAIQDNPGFIDDIANKLIEAVCENVTTASPALNRIFKGIINYNLRNADIENLDLPFTWKAKALTSNQFISLLEAMASQSGEYLKFTNFLKASSIREFIVAVVNDVVSQPDQILPIEISPRLLNAVINEVNSDKITDYLDLMIQKCPSMETVGYGSETAISNLRKAKSATDFLPGVFIDVGRTLVEYPRIGESRLSDFAEAFIKITPIDYRVTIFTGGDPISTTDELRKLGVPERFLPVQSKNKFVGKRLELVIDDTSPDIQGFAADKYIRPDLDTFMRSNPFNNIGAGLVSGLK